VPRYFFHVHDGKNIPDPQGVDLPSVAEAREQAIVAAGEMIRSDGHTVWNGSEWRMEVTDDTGGHVFTLRFSADDHAKA
jgi:hypothetical protein